MIAVACLELGAGSAAGLTVCRMPDGGTFVGDSVPPGCTDVRRVGSGSRRPAATPAPAAARPAPAPTARAPSVPASLVEERRAIEREANAHAKEVDRLRAGLAALRIVRPEDYPTTVEGSRAYYADLARHTTERERLRREEMKRLAEIARARKRFDELTARVRIASGGEVPRSWGPLACLACP